MSIVTYETRRTTTVKRTPARCPKLEILREPEHKPTDWVLVDGVMPLSIALTLQSMLTALASR